MKPNSKIALVTGGGRGIGAAISTKLASEGYQVLICGRNQERLQKHASAIGAQILVADLADTKACDQLVNTIMDEHKGVDVLVNNAGIAESASLKRSSDEAWDAMMAVNAKAVFRLTRAFVPAMVESCFGRVINIASNAGVSGYNYSSIYCASKHAVVGMTRALAVELAKTGVTVNAICPGWVDTDLVKDATARITGKTGRTEQDARDMLAKMSPQGRIIDPSEVAHTVSMLAHDDAKGINGQAIVIDGGQILK